MRASVDSRGMVTEVIVGSYGCVRAAMRLNRRERACGYPFYNILVRDTRYRIRGVVLPDGSFFSLRISYPNKWGDAEYNLRLDARRAAGRLVSLERGNIAERRRAVEMLRALRKAADEEHRKKRVAFSALLATVS